MTPTRRQFVAGALGTLTAGRAVADPPSAANLGLLSYSYGLRSRAEKGFADPIKFLTFAKSRGATAVQLSLGTTADPAAVRRAAEAAAVYVEGIVSPPADDRADRDRFAAELAAAKGCGATVVRTVMLGGRRYEMFDKPADYPAFAERAATMLRRAEPVARKQGVKLAVENHKDFRTDELIDLLKGVSSVFVGVCLDTGNNLALLEDATATAVALAPFTLTVHLKDMGVEEAADGFRLAEVPLGRGALDLPAIVAAVRKHNPRARFQLEMITRDPLRIPCLTDKYWATLGRVPGQDLARTLAFVRRVAGKQPLPRISGLSAAEQVAAEDANVADSFAFAVKSGLFPTG